MKVGFFQFDVTFGDKRKNLDKIHGALKGSDFDLMVLPELFTTGYVFGSKDEAAALAEPIPDGETVARLAEIAEQKYAYIIGGMAEVENDRLYNTAVIVGPDGYVGKHRKTHVTKLEASIFDRSDEINVFDLGGVKIGIVICFESWFPEVSRRLMFQGAQIVCNPANFGGPWSLEVIRVRALENIVFTVQANRIGKEHRNNIHAEFRGESQVVSCEGGVLLQAGGREEVGVVDIDPERAKQKSNIVCNDLIQELERCHK